METILVTGSAGFIGYFLTKKILNNYRDVKVIGVDNLNDYYDIALKNSRLDLLKDYNNFSFIRGSISDKSLVEQIFCEYKPSIVVNLAAQAGVRYSITNPDIYIESNIIGFYIIIENCRKHNVNHLIYASSSSVYGNSIEPQNKINDNTDKPVSLYAATKKSNELIAYSYSHLFDFKTTGLRFFTVYGPLGRPDMAYFNFTNKLKNKETINIYNYGNNKRDFTYVDDVVESIMRIINTTNREDLYKIYNIGSSNPVKVLDFINILQEELIEAKVLLENYNYDKLKNLIEPQQGDVLETYADTSELVKDYNYKPTTSLKKGLREFSKWYKDYYK